ncbi:unnamed protein product, partial [Discosporangium mesarthrocarpum]
MERETGASPRTGGGQSARALQIRMVRALKNHVFARDAWRYIVVPSLFGVP